MHCLPFSIAHLSPRGILLCGVLFVTGCAQSRAVDIEVIDERPSVKIEAIDSSLAEDLRKIDQVPLQFKVGIPASRYAWERASLFFEAHTSGGKFIAGKGTMTAISNEHSTDPVHYTIERYPSKNGDLFKVRCSGSDDLSAGEVELRCKNFARFVRDGRLEAAFEKQRER